MDLILGKNDVVKLCASEWNLRWTPAILHHSDTLSGKAATIYKQNQMACQSNYIQNFS